MPRRMKLRKKRICSIPGCGEPHIAKGLCSTHYQRKQQNRDLYVVVHKRERHGMEDTRAYRIWNGIKRRCTNPKDPGYKNYGGRGITVCKEWSESFQAFYRDMGDPPTENHQIDRKNNNKGYNKDNCRWVLHVENSQNRRSTKLSREDVIAIRQSTLSHEELAGMYNVDRSHINRIVNRVHWPNI